MNYSTPRRCPVCQSSKWKKVGTENKGFSVGKSVVGGLLFGPVGLVGGALGKSKETYYCPDCGFKNDYDA